MKGVIMKVVKKTQIKEISDGYTNLANAIVLRAVEDFKYAVLEDNRRTQHEIRRFFKSSWCAFLTKLNTDGLADRLQREVLEFERLTRLQLNEKSARKVKKDLLDEMTAEEKAEYMKQFQNVFRCPTCGGKVNMAYGWLGQSKRKQRFYNFYGWTVCCNGCGFKIKQERENRIAERSKRKTNEQ